MNGISETVEEAIDGLADVMRTGLSNLGTGNAATSMGAIELLSFEVKEGSTRVAESLNIIGEALSRIADVMEEELRRKE